MSTGPAAQITLFSAMWAIALAAHAVRTEPFSESLVWILIFACVYLLARPSSPGRLGFLAVTQLLLLFERMPVVDNQMYMMAFVNAGILVVAMPMVWRREAWTGASVRPALSWALVALILSYGAAAFSKLNTGFFDPVGSCAIAKTYQAAASFGISPGGLPAWFEAAVPLGVAAAELAIPLLLLFRRTRFAGILFAVVFHLAISITPTASAIDFTLTITALLYAAVPARSAELALDLWDAFRRRVVDPLGIDRAGLSALVLLGLYMTIRWRMGSIAGNRGWILVAGTAVLAGALLVYLVVLARRRGLEPAPVTWRMPVRHAVLLVPLLANLATPYLGVKTTGAMTMYSNLNTFDGRTNHVLVPAPPASSMHADIVEIVDSPLDELDAIRRMDRRITWHELRRIMAEHPDEPIAYRRDGTLFELSAARENPELITVDGVWHRLVSHRVHDPHNTECLW